MDMRKSRDIIEIKHESWKLDLDLDLGLPLDNNFT